MPLGKHTVGKTHNRIAYWSVLVLQQSGINFMFPVVEMKHHDLI